MPGNVPATTTDTALAVVEEQMALLAKNIRASLRDTALCIHPTLQPFGFKFLRMLERCGPTPAGALAENLVVDKSIISRQARALFDLDLITTQALTTTAESNISHSPPWPRRNWPRCARMIRRAS
jgi:DNA-binding MarR family transcriptional regulator